METAPAEPSTSDILMQQIVEHAKRLGIPIASDKESEVLLHHTLRTARSDSPPDIAPVKTEVPQLPRINEPRPGILLGHYAILTSALGESPAEASQWIHASEYHAIATLSWLPRKYREDLHLFFVGPTGADGDPAWLEIASRIERDERICRKLVWLPSKTRVQESADIFLERTFFARPWEALTSPSQPRLDPIEDVVQMLSTIQDLRDTPPTIVRKWLDVLTQPGEVSDVVTPLILALEELELKK